MKRSSRAQQASGEGSTIHTGQLFFDDELTDALYASTAPYSELGERDARNSNDDVYADGGDQSTLTVTKDGNAYAASMTMGVAS